MPDCHEYCIRRLSVHRLIGKLLAPLECAVSAEYKGLDAVPTCFYWCLVRHQLVFCELAARNTAILTSKRGIGKVTRSRTCLSVLCGLLAMLKHVTITRYVHTRARARAEADASPECHLWQTAATALCHFPHSDAPRKTYFVNKGLLTSAT